MIHPPAHEDPDGLLGSFFSTPVLEIQSEVRGLLDLAASRRSTARRLEEPVRHWEMRSRVHPSKGTHWETSLRELTTALAAASGVHRRVYEAEGQALPLINAGILRIRRSPSGAESRIPRGVLRMLEISAGLHADSLTAIERALAVSSQIGAFTTRNTVLEVLALLDERRRAIAESEACRNRADAIVRRAFRLETNRVDDMESAAVKALGVDDEVLAVRQPGPRHLCSGDRDWKNRLCLEEDAYGLCMKRRSGGSPPLTEECRPITAKLPAPEGVERELAVARLKAAEARLVQAIATRDRALARVALLSERAGGASGSKCASPTESAAAPDPAMDEEGATLLAATRRAAPLCGMQRPSNAAAVS